MRAAQDVLRPSRVVDHAIREALLQGFDGGKSSTVHRHDHFRCELCQAFDGLADAFRRRAAQMKAANDRVDVRDPGHLPSVPDGIDHAGMTAGGEDHVSVRVLRPLCHPAPRGASGGGDGHLVTHRCRGQFVCGSIGFFKIVVGKAVKTGTPQENLRRNVTRYRLEQIA